jgi:hypothetical protein
VFSGENGANPPENKVFSREHEVNPPENKVFSREHEVNPPEDKVFSRERVTLPCASNLPVAKIFRIEAVRPVGRLGGYAP